MKGLTLSLPRVPAIDFTLSNARRFYSSMGNPTGVKGLNAPEGSMAAKTVELPGSQEAMQMRIGTYEAKSRYAGM